jgi:hypothetical protein
VERDGIEVSTILKCFAKAGFVTKSAETDDNVYEADNDIPLVDITNVPRTISNGI